MNFDWNRSCLTCTAVANRFANHLETAMMFCWKLIGILNWISLNVEIGWINVHRKSCDSTMQNRFNLAGSNPGISINDNSNLMKFTWSSLENFNPYNLMYLRLVNRESISMFFLQKSILTHKVSMWRFQWLQSYFWVQPLLQEHLSIGRDSFVIRCQYDWPMVKSYWRKSLVVE